MFKFACHILSQWLKLSLWRQGLVSDKLLCETHRHSFGPRPAQVLTTSRRSWTGQRAEFTQQLERSGSGDQQSDITG
jgi:hypothetical protein